MSPREHSIVLIRARNFCAGDNAQFYSWDVSLKEPEEGLECPRTTAIANYFRDRHKIHCLFKFDTTTHYDQLGFDVHKGLVKYFVEVLPSPFLEIRIVREREEDDEEDQDSINSADLLVLEKRILLKDMVNSERLERDEDWDGNEDVHSMKIPFRHDFPSDTNFLYWIKLGWKEPAKKIKMCTATLMGKLFEDDSSKDLNILAGNGAEVMCHKLIFAAQTLAFSAMLSAKTGMKEAQSKKVELRENSEEGIRKLVQYLYGLELDISDMGSDVALELFQTAHKYGLSELEGSLLELFLDQDKEWFSPDVVLEMYFYVRNLNAFEKLREHALFLMASMATEELCSCDVFKKLGRAEAVGISMKLVDYLKKNDFHKLSRPRVEMRDGGAKRRRISHAHW